MPKLDSKKKREIYDRIADSLKYYREWKAGHPVPELAKPYLELLDPHVSNYLGALDRLEEDACDYYLANWNISRIVKLNYFVKARVDTWTVKKWIFGTREYDGLVNSMMHVFLRLYGEDCPFCQRDRFGDGSIHPKVNGTPCPHREIWEEQEAKEAAR